MLPTLQFSLFRGAHAHLSFWCLSLELHNVTHRALSCIYVGPCAILVLGYLRFVATPCYPQGPVSYLGVSLYVHNGFLLTHLWFPYWRTTSSLLAPHCFLISPLPVRMLAPH